MLVLGPHYQATFHLAWTIEEMSRLHRAAIHRALCTSNPTKRPCTPAGTSLTSDWFTELSGSPPPLAHKCEVLWWILEKLYHVSAGNAECACIIVHRCSPGRSASSFFVMYTSKFHNVGTRNPLSGKKKSFFQV